MNQQQQQHNNKKLRYRLLIVPVPIEAAAASLQDSSRREDFHGNKSKMSVHSRTVRTARAASDPYLWGGEGATEQTFNNDQT